MYIYIYSKPRLSRSQALQERRGFHEEQGAPWKLQLPVPQRETDVRGGR